MRKLPFVLTALCVSTALQAQCIVGTGTSILIAQDSITGPNPIGFAFPFCGGTYTDIHLSDHGICFLTNGGVPAVPAAGPLVWTPQSSSLVTNGPVVCPLWSDTIPGTPTATFHIDAQPTQCTISWIGVQSFNIPTPKMSFQMQLFPTGELLFIYGPTVTNNSLFGGVSDNGVVGVSPGIPATLPAGVNFLTNPVSVDNTIHHQYVVANTFDMQGGTLRLIPTSPGWVALYTPNGANCASSQAYGTGCGNLAFSISGPPIVSTSINLQVAGITPTAPFGGIALGFVRHDPGLPLTGIGMPGCFQYNEMLAVNLFFPLGAPSVSIPFAVPNFPGVVLQAFAISYDPTAALTPFGAVSSDAEQLNLGN